VSGVTPGGRKIRRGLSGHTTFSIRPESGGTSVFDPSRRRVWTGRGDRHLGGAGDNYLAGDWDNRP
jgi:hypothetical protein